VCVYTHVCGGGGGEGNEMERATLLRWGEAAQIHNYNLTGTMGIKNIDYVHMTPYTKCSK